MATTKSVVTTERYSQGLTYEEYLAQIKVNKDRFQQYYDGFKLEDEDTQRLRKAAGHPQGPSRMLVLGEDWCPDVFRGLPTLARVAEAADMEMRVFPRDQNHDIMNEFLKDGKHMSIPAAVFYTADHGYICHWIERPEVANREMDAVAAQIKAENPNITDQEFLAVRRARTVDRWPAWQQATVEEIIEVLNRSLGL